MKATSSSIIIIQLQAANLKVNLAAAAGEENYRENRATSCWANKTTIVRIPPPGRTKQNGKGREKSLSCTAIWQNVRCARSRSLHICWAHCICSCTHVSIAAYSHFHCEDSLLKDDVLDIFGSTSRTTSTEIVLDTSASASAAGALNCGLPGSYFCAALILSYLSDPRFTWLVYFSY